MSSRPGIEELQPPSPVQQEVADIAARPETRTALEWLRTAEPQLAQWQMEMAAIPSPPFGEAARGEWLKRRFQELGLLEIRVDEVGNIFGQRQGTTGEDYVSISAHIDTVFPDGTPLDVRQDGTRLFGPGISDNGAGATAMLAVAGSLRAANIPHSLPLLFIGNVGEEGEGDLRGMRHIFTQSTYRDRIHYSVVLDGAGSDTVVSEALGSLRFEVVVRGPGGHSWTDFGLPNPILALARGINYFSETPLPASPKTTFNVGVVRGGNSVNSIPESA
ncbi:MAG: M20/M25/M40 family metallo-hydrolase, partial [Acidobacteriales bacterium]|nr:M20/M25/M40 family metallo-hydrolase [Terriglobales bacterium]